MGRKITFKESPRPQFVRDNYEILDGVWGFAFDNDNTGEEKGYYNGFEKQYDIVLEEYECLIYGDINGDGKISAMDYTLIKNHIMDVKKITDTNMKLTADINGDNKISAMDYTLIKNDIMDVKKLEIK